MKTELVDTGPLVAILSRRDQYHVLRTEAMRAITPPLLTRWPVITEAAWLLRQRPSGVEKLLSQVETGLLQILPLASDDAPAISAILKKYRKLNPQIAGAALVHLAGRESIRAAFTLDRRDFGVYRHKRNRVLQLIPQ